MKKTKLVKKRYLCLLFIGVILAIGMSSMSVSSAASTVSVNTTGNDSHTGTYLAHIKPLVRVSIR